MRDYVIYTDSSADLGADMISEMNVEMINLTFNLDGENYQNWPDGREISFNSFYERLRAGGVSSTSQINGSAFIDAFAPILEQGKDVLYLGFSSGLSGTVGSAMMVVPELKEQYPGAEIVVVDTLAASLGQGLLVWYAANLKKEGKTLQEVAHWVESNKLKMAHWFTVDDLNFLKRGGRLSGAGALLGTMLSIKPVLHVDDEGHLVAMEKVRGRQQSLKKLADRMEKMAINPGEQMVFISHADCRDEAEFLADEIRKRFGTKEIYINFVGPVIGSHSGPGTMALFFMAASR